MIDKHADITFNNNVFMLTGELNFLNVMSVYTKSLDYLNQCKSCVFDFSSVKSSDSAGLALMIEWLKFASANQKEVHFQNVSEDLLSIATAAGLEKVIQS